MKELNETQEGAGREKLLSNPSQTAIESNSIADRASSTLLEPETYPITRKQLVNEVKGVYAGLVMVEKCI
jgi:hypothetical protein